MDLRFATTLIALLASGSGLAHPRRTAADGCLYCRTNCAKWGEVANARHCHDAQPNADGRGSERVAMPGLPDSVQDWAGFAAADCRIERRLSGEARKELLAQHLPHGSPAGGAVLPIYLTHYNQHRDHSSLGYRPPMTRMPGVNNVHGIHTGISPARLCIVSTSTSQRS